LTSKHFAINNSEQYACPNLGISKNSLADHSGEEMEGKDENLNLGSS